MPFDDYKYPDFMSALCMVFESSKVGRRNRRWMLRQLYAEILKDKDALSEARTELLPEIHKLTSNKKIKHWIEVELWNRYRTYK